MNTLWMDPQQLVSYFLVADEEKKKNENAILISSFCQALLPVIYNIFLFFKYFFGGDF
jgi:hypothetical protein